MAKFGAVLFGFFVVLTGCRTGQDGSETKDVQDIAAVTNGSIGMTVVCKDGTTTEVSTVQFQQQVADNTICDGNGGGGSNPQSEVMCVSYNQTTSQIARISDGNTIGTNVPHQICQDAIQASRNGMVCMPYNGQTAQVFRLSDSQTIGSNLPFDACNEQVKSQREGLICAAYNSTTSQIYKLSNLNTLGTNVTHEICSKLVAGARAGMVCSPYNAQTSQITRLSNMQTIGSNLPHEQCILNIPH